MPEARREDRGLFACMAGLPERDQTAQAKIVLSTAILDDMLYLHRC